MRTEGVFLYQKDKRELLKVYREMPHDIRIRLLAYAQGYSLGRGTVKESHEPPFCAS